MPRVTLGKRAPPRSLAELSPGLRPVPWLERVRVPLGSLVRPSPRLAP